MRVGSEGGVDKWNNPLCSVISTAMSEVAPIKKVPKDRLVVPWWNKACNSAVHMQCKAYRRLRRHPLEEYKRLRAKV